MQLDLRCWKLAVGGFEDSADQDPKADPRQHVVGSGQLSGVCLALVNVIVVDSARERQLVRRRVWPCLDVRSDLAGRRERIIALLP